MGLIEERQHQVEKRKYGNRVSGPPVFGELVRKVPHAGLPSLTPRSGGLQTPSNAQAFERGTEIVMGFELLKSGVESVAAKGV
jgi:hypothetical protein